MTKLELLELLSNGENSGVEFKQDTIGARQLAKELVALANLAGGCVVLGVDDAGSIVGLTRVDESEAGQEDQAERASYARLEQWVAHVCRDKIRPELNPYFQILRDVLPSMDVAVVGVERGYGVHHVWHNNGRKYYVRVGSTSREASPEELARLFQQRGSVRVERQPVPGALIDDLDMRRLVDYFERVRGYGTPQPGRSSALENSTGDGIRREDESWQAQRSRWEQLLVNTEILVDGDTHPATVAGLVVFGKRPDRLLPQSKIDAVAYPGSEKDYHAIERRTLRGPLVGLFGTGGELVEPGLLEQAMDFVWRHTGKTELQNGVRRIERWDYPVEAVREALVNAVVHRDYLLSHTDTELSIYSDRLEVVSAGGLPNGITTARMRTGCRAARNELIKDIMRDYGYLEHMGMGIPRKIIRGMREHNGTEPELVAENERLVVRLWKEAPERAA